MLAADELVLETESQFYRVLGFITFSSDMNSRYDLRTKSLDTMLDLMVAVANRPTYKGKHCTVSITIGVLNFSCEAIAPEGLEIVIKGALDIMQWRFQ